MRVRTIGAVAALLLVVAGCGTSDNEAKKAIADSIMKASDSGLAVKQSEADCIAGGFVDDIGVDKLKKYGILTEDGKTDESLSDVKMSADDADAAASAFVDCVDVQELLNDQMQLDSMDAATAACVKEAFSDDVMHDVLAATFQGEDPSTAAPDMVTKLQECMTS